MLRSKRARAALSVIVLLGAAAAVAKHRNFKKRVRDASKSALDESASASSSGKKKKQKSSKLDKNFLRKLRSLLRIVVPSKGSRSALLMAAQMTALITRTLLSIAVSKLDGRIVRATVKRDGVAFAKLLAMWLGIAVPATAINSLLRFLESQLALSLRTQLVQRAYELYMSNDAFYAVGNMDSRLRDPDQLLTEDAERWAALLAKLYSSLSKPLLDIVLMTVQMLLLGRQARGESSGKSGKKLSFLQQWGTTIGTMLTLVGTTVSLRLASPPFGKLVGEQARRAGALRATHTRLLGNCEEVAFQRGHEVEHSVLLRAYESLESQMRLIIRSRFGYKWIEQFLTKYVWSFMGILIVAVPQFQSVLLESEESRSSASLTNAVSQRTELLVTSRAFLKNIADAIERLMSSYKEITELAGYTSRVSQLLEVLKDCKEGRFQKQLLASAELPENAPLVHGVGEVRIDDERVCFDKVPIVTPNGDVLIRSMSLDLCRGQHLLIIGPNGCGKSSFFRTLGGLWPCRGGVLTKPSSDKMFYIPQRPYFTRGTLRQQVLYPHAEEDYKSAELDAELMQLLQDVDLTYLLEREGGLDQEADFQDLLSGGEQQRLAMARLFYHRPHFAILDECTSACSMDVEARMYQHAKARGITLLTVSHRPSLWKWHSHVLHYLGDGKYRFEELDLDAMMNLKERKNQLEEQLAGIPKMRQRLKDLCDQLGEESSVMTHVGHE